MLKKEIESLKFKSGIELYSLFMNDDFLKSFIKKLFQTAQKINKEENNDFHSIIAIMNKTNTNEYLLADIDIILITLIETFNSLNVKREAFLNFQNAIKKSNDYKEKEFAGNILYLLAKRKIVYYSDVNKFYYHSRYVRHTSKIKYTVELKTIAINYQSIKHLFNNDKTFIEECNNIISRKYGKYKKRKNLKKQIKTFTLKMSKYAREVYFNVWFICNNKPP